MHILKSQHEIMCVKKREKVHINIALSLAKVSLVMRLKIRKIMSTLISREIKRELLIAKASLHRFKKTDTVQPVVTFLCAMAHF